MAIFKQCHGTKIVSTDSTHSSVDSLCNQYWHIQLHHHGITFCPCVCVHVIPYIMTLCACIMPFCACIMPFCACIMPLCACIMPLCACIASLWSYHVYIQYNNTRWGEFMLCPCGFVSCPCMLVSRFPLLKANLITIECWNVAVCISYKFVYKHSYLVSYQEIYQIFCVPQIIAAAVVN